MNPQNKLTALSADLNNFIYGVSRRNFQNAPELTKTGISLLKNFPAARDAVLEYFGMIFHDAVNVSINQSEYESDNPTSGSMESVSMIGPELTSLGPSWAPFIAPWCINLIMDIATDKANVSTTLLQGLDPIRVLMDITIQNLTLLDNEERAKCIDMMLGCRACSWAVGWVGRVEPLVVAPRALALGADAARSVLAHLANHPPALVHIRTALLDLFKEALEDRAEKKRDVIPYLLTLASKSDIVLKALTQDIENTLTEDVMKRLCELWWRDRETGSWEAVGPGALVALALRSTISCLLVLIKYANTYLFCRQLLEYLLQKLEYESMLPDKRLPLLSSAAEEVSLVRERLLTGNQLEQYSLARVLIIVCYNHPSEFVRTISYLLQYSRTDTTLALLVRIISGTISMHTPNDSPDISLNNDRYQKYIKTGVEYALRGAMRSDEQIKRCFVEETAEKDMKTYTHHFCLNIVKLLRWENSGRVSHMRTRRIGRAVEANLFLVGGALKHYASLLRPRPEATCAAMDEMPTCHALTEVLERVDMSGTKGPPPSVEVIIKVVQAIVKYFFRCLHLTDIMEKLQGTQLSSRALRKVCLHSKFARALALRELLETALFREEATFGSRIVVDNTVDNEKEWGPQDLLIHLNQKHLLMRARSSARSATAPKNCETCAPLPRRREQDGRTERDPREHGPITQLTQSHTSVFHAGVIGGGVRRGGHDESRPPPALTANTELLMGALMACMDGNSGIVEGMTSVSLLLVELVSPDVMYNGLPWPDEDFTKQVSIERELYMRTCIENSAVVRSALYRAATVRPSLTLASALLRAVAATLLHRLRALLADRHPNSTEMSREMTALQELLTLMTLGQLLPHPLCHMLQLAPYLTTSEIVQIVRDCLWNYTRDHVPSPALFSCDSTGLHWRDPSTSKPPAAYTDTLRLIIQKRIAKLGHLYPIMFLNLEKTEN